MSAQFSVPAILDDNYPAELESLLQTWSDDDRGKDDKIANVYGSLPRSILGHARYPYSIPDVSIKFLESYVTKLSELDIEFHYTLNSMWSGGIERTRSGQQQIIKEIDELLSIGIKDLIIANPYLIQLIKNEFQDINIIGSTNLQASSVPSISSYLLLGLDSIILDKKVNRDYQLLDKIVDDFGDKVTLLVNSTCLANCPFSCYHTLETGLASSYQKVSDADYGLLNPNFCFNYCIDTYLEKPWNFLKSQWIIPEQLEYYTNIGIKNFKIQGRTLSTSNVIDLLHIYHERKTINSDLFEIWPGFKDSLMARKNNLTGSTQVENIKISDIVKTGFLDKLISKKSLCSRGCESCGLCFSTYNKIKRY